MEPKAYGKYIITNGKHPPTDTVGHILGCLVEYDDHGKPEYFRLHYETNGDRREMIMSHLDSMFLLSILKAIQLDHGIPFPDDPRAPSARS